jgi:hypothetical protein
MMCLADLGIVIAENNCYFSMQVSRTLDSKHYSYQGIISYLLFLKQGRLAYGIMLVYVYPKSVTHAICDRHSSEE